MPTNSPDIFFNTISAASIKAELGSVVILADDVPIPIEADFSDTISPKNMKTTIDGKIEAEWVGTYFFNFSCTANGGKDKNYLLAPYKNGVKLNVGNIEFRQQLISGEILPLYEISTSFIIGLEKGDDIQMYIELDAVTPASQDFSIDYASLDCFQLEQVGVH